MQSEIKALQKKVDIVSQMEKERERTSSDENQALSSLMSSVERQRQQLEDVVAKEVESLRENNQTLRRELVERERGFLKQMRMLEFANGTEAGDYMMSSKGATFGAACIKQTVPNDGINISMTMQNALRGSDPPSSRTLEGNRWNSSEDANNYGARQKSNLATGATVHTPQASQSVGVQEEKSRLGVEVKELREEARQREDDAAREVEAIRQSFARYKKLRSGIDE